MKEIVLASASPRRRELLEMLGLTVIVRPSGTEEKIGSLTDPQEIVTALAEQKARSVPRKPEELILAADTVVAIDRRILGKPKDEADAFRMLSLLSGREHSVFTGFCLLRGEESILGAEETKVFFRSLSPAVIQRYLATGEPFDKAGAYGIQGKGCCLAEGIQGDFYNVVGLPVSRIMAELRRWGEEL